MPKNRSTINPTILGPASPPLTLPRPAGGATAPVAAPPGAANPAAAVAGKAAPAAAESPYVKAERESRLIEDRLVPAQLLTLLDCEKAGISVLGVRMYLAKLTAGITDPIEKMLVREFAVAHHRLMDLHLAASAAQAVEAAKIYNASAARLQGELRRLALAIRAYRLPPGQKSFSVVHQQNVVANGEQHVQYTNQGQESLVVRDELKGAGNPLEDRIRGDMPNTSEEPAEGGRGAAQRPQAAAVDA